MNLLMSDAEVQNLVIEGIIDNIIYHKRPDITLQAKEEAEQIITQFTPAELRLAGAMVVKTQGRLDILSALKKVSRLKQEMRELPQVSQMLVSELVVI